jgi:Flp pilus assembly protein TadB
MNLFNLASTATAKTEMQQLRSQLTTNYTRQDAQQLLHAARKFRTQRAITLRYVLALSCGICALAAIVNVNDLLTGRHPSILLLLALVVAALAVAVSIHTILRNHAAGQYENSLTATDTTLETTQDHNGR